MRFAEFVSSLLVASSDAVDIFNANSGKWSTAALSVARSFLAATSLPDQGLAIFAGGSLTGMHVCRDL
jgi:hypothetical protein